MDILREAPKKSLLKRYWPVVAVAGVIVAGIAVSKSIGGASYVVDHRNLVFGDVKRGEFAVQVRGVGSLVPKNIQWLSANVDGHVESIAVEAGASVKRGDVIAVLSNPKLAEQLKEADWELAAQEKENRAAEMSLQSQLEDLRAAVKNAELDYQSAQLKVDAEKNLVETGVVSKLTFGQSQLAAAQHKERIASQGARLKTMQANLAATAEAHAARLQKMKNSRDQVQQQIDDLTVRASIDGIVQEMPLKLGQQVTPGAEVAKIAPHDNLVALLDIQDFQVKEIALGQAASIDTRSSKIAGKVVRIDPAVSNGVVKVEVALEGAIPAEARPDLSVEGLIDVANKPDALFVTRPSFAQSFGKVALYRVDADGDTARRTTVELGRASARFIEVVGGLKEGDRVIVSDPSAWQGHDSILIR